MAGKVYMMILTIFAIVVAWYFVGRVKPKLIEAGCNDVAAKSSDLYYKNRTKDDAAYSYDNVKQRCLEDAYYANASTGK